MITPEERAEKIRNAPSNSSRIFRKMSPQQQQERVHQALHHTNDAGMSSADEYAYLRRKETEACRGR